MSAPSLRRMDDFDIPHGSWHMADRRPAAPLGSGPGTRMNFPDHRPLFGGTGDWTVGLTHTGAAGS
ncbi:hypothetical protein [Kitasatospora sp. HPMI-4]|uniref:hypothetical protein n=1 Tax=Kitasatospora sp. HPMI-4 TaxID=3448443 RepID=UPI003F1B4E9F